MVAVAEMHLDNSGELVLAEAVGAATTRLEALQYNETLANDPVLQPALTQYTNHLRHVSYDFRIARDSEDYPYRLKRSEAYEPIATNYALQRAERLLDLAAAETAVFPTVELDEAYRTTAQAEQDRIAYNLLENPLEVYKDFSERRLSGGAEAAFPELGWTLKSLFYDMAKDEKVLHACEASPLLSRLRGRMMQEVGAKIEEDIFGYTSTIWMIEDAASFFDLVVRVNDEKPPEIYHTGRFEYNWQGLAADSEHTVLPTMASVTSADLLKIRGVPVGLIGVVTDSIRVDGKLQTPYEFFHHDVDHTRRMWEETQVAVERDGISVKQFSEVATDLLHNKLLPAVDLEGIEDEAERDRRIAMRMILFEVLHEDAYDPTPDTIADAILREPLEHTPFEHLVDDKTVEYFTGPRASTLAHVFRKLTHDFYDLPEARSANLGTDYVRTRSAIVEGAARLYRLVSDDPVSDEELITTCREIISSDEGFTAGFLGNLAHDIDSRGRGRDLLRFMVTHPLGVATAVRKVREDGRKVHSLFGYSALEYEHPELLAATVEADLQAFVPEETIIAIGATPYGIGNMYEVAKDLGFMTLGIVSSIAVSRDEEASLAVDKIVVVKDKHWGGHRFGPGSEGLLSPTTRVFVGASDSMSAYGGGYNTAVALEEMVRRRKPASFKSFDMNHRIADISQAQKGESGAIDYRGLAHKIWQKLNS